jgi:hypothetical protein
MSQFPNAFRYIFFLSKSNIKRLEKGIEILPIAYIILVLYMLKINLWILLKDQRFTQKH